MRKATKYLNISPKVRKIVRERDECCIFCESQQRLEVAHYIPKSRMGLAIPENLAMVCHDCHMILDQGKHREKRINMKLHFRSVLDFYYPYFTDEQREYRKGQI